MEKECYFWRLSESSKKVATFEQNVTVTVTLNEHSVNVTRRMFV